MKTIIERSDLLKALNHVQSVVERRNTIPILSNVLLEADSGVLALTATDLEIEMRERVEAEILQPGSITAPAHMLYDIVRKLPDGAQVELGTDETGGRLNLMSGKSIFTLQALPREDFPAMAQDEMPAAFALPVKDLGRLIEKTRFAISVEETRYYLNGVYFHCSEEDGKKVLRAVATDGHRLARIDCDLPDAADQIPGVIIPRKTVGEVRSILDGLEERIAVSVSPNKIRFSKFFFILYI